MNFSRNDFDRASKLKEERNQLETQISELRAKLVAGEADQKLLADKLTEANNKVAGLTERAHVEEQSSLQESQRAAHQITVLASEIEKLQFQLDASKAKLTAAQLQSEQLQARLEQTESELQREHDMKSSKKEMGDLIAARNLHIVDVYDTDNKGKVQRPFGRVFYIEGESLVFYAYDLGDPRQLRANVVFNVWGQRDGMKSTTHRLGILHNDGTSQDRWAMTFDDPEVLAQINAVFVTAEAASKHHDEPQGKRILYAYFGSKPNHP